VVSEIENLYAKLYEDLINLFQRSNRGRINSRIPRNIILVSGTDIRYNRRSQLVTESL
jgi:hypothetical protein